MKDKKHKHSSSMFFMLAGQYGIFTIVVLVFTLGFLVVAEQLVQGQYKESEEDVIAQAIEKIRNTDYDRIDVEALLGQDSWMLILDEKDNVVYRSLKYPEDLVITNDDLQFMNSTYLYTYPSEYESNGETLVSYSVYANEELLDEAGTLIARKSDGKVLYCDIARWKNRTYLTEQQRSFLYGEYEDSILRRAEVTLPNGKTGSLVIGISGNSLTKHERTANLIDTMSFPILVAGYLLILYIFIKILSRYFRRPVQMLSSAMDDMAKGERGRILDYQGPEEFEHMVNSFNVMSERLNEAEIEREKAEQDKRQMLADISHDLKTPITVIEGYSKAIVDGVVAPNNREKYLRTIYTKSEQLSELINVFHTYSKLEHPEFTLNLRKVNLTETVRSYFASKYAEAELAGMEMEAEIPDEVSVAMVDVMNFRRALENIISNVLKYNPEGTKIHVSYVIENQTGIIRICDNGIGIDAKLKENLFDPFVMGDVSRGPGHGSGLGLAITRKIIENHNGRVCLKDVPDWKTCFEITIPLVGK